VRLPSTMEISKVLVVKSLLNAGHGGKFAPFLKFLGGAFPSSGGIFFLGPLRLGRYLLSHFLGRIDAAGLIFAESSIAEMGTFQVTQPAVRREFLRVGSCVLRGREPESAYRGRA